MLLDNGDLVKTVKFKNPNYLGDPINALKIFNEKGVDEICVMDIRASLDGSYPNYELLKEMAEEAFMPLSYGGGISSTEEMATIFRLGYEKVIISSAWCQNNDLIKDASKRFGSQSIVVAVDYKRKIGGEKCFTYSGTKAMPVSPVEMAKRAERCGAGEILLYSIDRDGKKCGYDISTISRVSKNIDIPLIACGGASDLHDVKKALSAGADAAAAGSIFVYFGKISGILINYPDYMQFVQSDIYDKELIEYEL